MKTSQIFEQTAFEALNVRVNNRQANIDFYQQVLGLKVFHEENAYAFLGGHADQSARIVLEESPAYRTRAVEGVKKLSHLFVTIPFVEIAGLLARKVPVEQVFQGKDGYGFTAVSPEGDRITVYGTAELADTGVIAYPDLPASPDFAGVTTVAISSLALHVVDEAVSRPFYKGLPLPIELVSQTGSDLTALNDSTWDLASLTFSVNESQDLQELADYFAALGGQVQLLRKGRSLVVTDPSNMELWFEK